MTNRDILRLLGQRIRDARLAVNMTQECLAELVGVHWKTIGSIERGRYPFAVTTFVRMTRHLNISSNRLLDNLANPNPQQSERVKKALARKRKPHHSTRRS